MIDSKITDTDLLMLLPPSRAKEAAVLLRRLSIMRQHMTGASFSSVHALRDVDSLQLVVDTLNRIQEEECEEQVLRIHFENSESSHEKQ